jgi:hypothetical protein
MALPMRRPREPWAFLQMQEAAMARPSPNGTASVEKRLDDWHTRSAFDPSVAMRQRERGAPLGCGVVP